MRRPVAHAAWRFPSVIAAWARSQPRAGLWLGALLCVGAAGCASSKPPRQALAITPTSLEFRRLSGRRFDTHDEKLVLSACAGLMQDLGFTIDNSESDLGLINASKDRTAVQGGQVAAKVLYGAAFRSDLPIDEVQKFRTSIVTYPRNDGVTVRVTFQRIVWDDRGRVSRLERLDDPNTYQVFFARLSKALFLEAHGI